MRQEGEIEEERRLAARMLAEARATAPRLATMSSITEHRNRWVAYKVFGGGGAGRSIGATGRSRTEVDQPLPLGRYLVEHEDLTWFDGHAGY